MTIELARQAVGVRSANASENVWRRLFVALLVVPASSLLFGCGGGTDERPQPIRTGPTVGVIEAAAPVHCPERTLPVPPGLDFSGRVIKLPLTDQSFRGANFDNATVSGVLIADLTGATFRGAHIRGFALLHGSNLTNANFEGAIFDDDGSSPTLFESVMKDACFIGAKFSLAVNFQSVLDGVDFSYSDVLSVLSRQAGVGDALALNDGTGLFQKARFRGVAIPCEYLDKAYLKAMDLREAIVSSCATVFTGKDMSNFAFDGIDLRGFNFDGTNISNATFVGAQLGAAVGPPHVRVFAKAIGVGSADFSGAYFSYFSFGYTSGLGTLPGNDLHLERSKFAGATFDNVLLTSNLTDVHFETTTFRNVFLGGNISGAKFTGATFTGLQFAGPLVSPATDFSYATITGTGSPSAIGDENGGGANIFDGVHFDHAVLTNLRFDGARLRGTSFAYATFGQGVTFRNGPFAAGNDIHPVDATDAHFEHVNAVGTDFSQIVAPGAIFDNASLANTRWNGATLDAASFQGATLSGAVFSGAQARGALFNKAIAIGADFSNTAGLQGANFSNAELSNSTFANALLDSLPTATPPIVDSALFAGAHLKNVNFNNARLNGANFQSASLYGNSQPASCVTDIHDAKACPKPTGQTCGCASAKGAQMLGTRFGRAFLYGVDFSNASFGGTNFQGAILVASNFGGSTFNLDTSKDGSGTSFAGAQLQGVNLSDADLTGVSLQGAQVDFGIDGKPFQGNSVAFDLDGSYTAFPNSPAPGQHVCVGTLYEATMPSRLPAGAKNMTCPNGSTLAQGCGANSSTNPNWMSTTAIANGTPPGVYLMPASFSAVTSGSACTPMTAPIAW